MQRGLGGLPHERLHQETIAMSTLNKRLLATFIITSTLTLGACQGQKQTKTQAGKVETSQTANTKTVSNQTVANQDENITPDGWVVVENETFIPIVDELGNKLSLARKSYLKGDNEAAAVAMREGSAFLKQEIPKADAEGKVALKKASDDLMSKASIVQMGEIDSVQDLDKIFSEAYQADIEQLWVVADEQQWIPIVEMPQQHWQQAKQDFNNKKYAAAANEVRKGTAFLNLEANRTKDQDIKADIQGSAQNLEQLAKNIKEGKVTDVAELELEFARGQVAMGQFYKSQAKDSESQGKLVIAGNEIISSFHHLQAANNWLDMDLGNIAAAQTEIDRVRDNLGSPNEALSRSLSKAIITVNEQIGKMSEDLAQL